MRLLVCGDRNWSDREAIHAELGFMHSERPIACIIHGASVGADDIAGEWARLNGVEEVSCPANWLRFGRRAGPMRNAEMLAQHKPDHVLAFHDDLAASTGTVDMVTKAMRARLPVTQWSHSRGAILFSVPPLDLFAAGGA